MDLPGGVVEWLMALVLKTSVPKGTVGSNPTPSVEIESEVGDFYWTVQAPDIVNSGREEQGSVRL